MTAAIHVHIDIDSRDYEAARYAFRVLLATAGVPVVFHRSPPSLPPDAVLITYSRDHHLCPAHRRHLIICASRRLWEHYGSDRSLPPRPMVRISLEALGVEPSPRLPDFPAFPYVAEAAPPTAEFRTALSPDAEAAIVTGVDLVASTLFWITRYEESLIRERDEVGRVPQEHLRMIQEGLTSRPLVDEYSELLMAWLQRLGGRLRPTRSPFRVVLTHDVDSGIGVRGVRDHADNGLRTFYRETFRQRRPDTALLGLGQWALRGAGLWTEPALFRDIVQLDAEFGFRSFFFLMANGTHAKDARYDIGSDAALGVIEAIRTAGGRVGLHVGLNAHGSPTQLRSEWERLRKSDPHARPVSRSHYLAFFAPATWRQLADVGVEVDSTLGFSRHLGFRCGTSRPFRPFDVERRTVLPMWELPMMVMDVALFQTSGREAARVAAVKEIEDRARAHGGCLVVNWHNVYCFGHYRAVYRAVLGSLRGAQGLVPDEVPASSEAVIS